MSKPLSPCTERAKIWVVEQGSYSDYRVVGVFTSKANAQIVVDKLKSAEYYYDEPTIAEWPLNPAVEELNAGLDHWRVLMLKDGTTERCDKSDMPSYNIEGSTQIWRRSTAPAYKGQGVQDALDATVWATDAKHAVKIVNEQRIQMIAGGQWK